MSTQNTNNETGEGFGRKIAKGAAWTILSRLAIRSIGLISTLILARLLVPEDFGLVALAMSFYAILDVMSAFGFDMVLIQNQKAERGHYDTAWTMNIVKGAVSALIMLVFADNVAAFFDEPRLEIIIQVMSVGMFITGFENIGIVAFRKELQFNKDFRFQVTNKVIAFIVTISLAFMFNSYWALIAGMMSGLFVAVVVSYLMHPYRPRLSLSKLGEIFHFSKWILFNNIIIYINRQGADVIIGKYNGPASLGMYSVAFEISNLPTTELVFPISRAIFPGYAMLQNEPHKFRRVFLNTLGFIAALAVPLGFGIAMLAELLVPVMLGEKWLGTIPLIQILAVYGVARVLISNTGAVYLALGKPHLTGYLVGLQLLFQIPALIWAASNYDVITATWVMLVSGLIFYPMHFFVVVRLLPMTLRDIGAALIRPFASVAVMCAALYGVFTIWQSDGTFFMFLQLIIMAIIGALVYVVTLFGLWTLSGRPEGAEQLALKEIEDRWGYRLPGMD